MGFAGEKTGQPEIAGGKGPVKDGRAFAGGPIGGAALRLGVAKVEFGIKRLGYGSSIRQRELSVSLSAADLPSRCLRCVLLRPFQAPLHRAGCQPGSATGAERIQPWRRSIIGAACRSKKRIIIAAARPMPAPGRHRTPGWRRRPSPGDRGGLRRACRRDRACRDRKGRRDASPGLKPLWPGPQAAERCSWLSTRLCSERNTASASIRAGSNPLSPARPPKRTESLAAAPT